MIKKYALLVIICAVLTSIWFSPKKMLAHAEEGLPFYRPQHTYQLYSNIWQDAGFGSVQPFSFPRQTLNRFVSWLDYFLRPAFRIQQLIFFLLLLAPLIITPFFVKELFPSLSQETRYITALLYLFNLFALTQVWQRFIYPLFFLWAYLPIFLYLFIRWIRSGKLIVLFLFLISSAVFSSSFALVSSVFALWLPAGILCIGNKKLVRGIAALVLWLITNIWWWLPIFTAKDHPYNQYLESSQNLTSLNDVSKFYPNEEIMLLKQKYFFSPDTSWYEFYSLGHIKLISILMFGLLVLGILTLLKFRTGIIIILWLIVSWFLIKGANPPLGSEFYTWLFNTFPFTVVLRNPYEKLGAIFLLPYVILVSAGLSRIPFRFLRITLVFCLVFILLRSMWTGQLFAGYHVEVPDTYRLSNSHLNSQGNFRLLQLPFLHGAGVKYTWGYSGEEPSIYLFDRPSVSSTYYRPGDPYQYLYSHLRSSAFYRLMQFFTIDTLVLHKDVVFGPGFYDSYRTTKDIVKQIDNLQPDKDFSNLETFKLDSNLPINWGYLSTRAESLPDIQSGLNRVVNDESFKLYEDSFVITPQEQIQFENNLPNYSLEKISPLHYRYQIQNSGSAYILILLVSFSDSWKAYINDKEVKNHIQINGFANGWIIDQPGSYNVEVKFRI